MNPIVEIIAAASLCITVGGGIWHISGLLAKLIEQVTAIQADIAESKTELQRLEDRVTRLERRRR